MAVAPVATVVGAKATGSSTTLGVSTTVNAATSDANTYLEVIVVISVSTNSAGTTCAVTCGGTAMTQKSLILLGSSTNRAAIGLYELANPGTGSKAVVATSGGASTKAQIAVGGRVYSGVNSSSTVTSAATTGLTVTNGQTGGKIIVGTTNGATLSAPNRNSLYLDGGAPAGVGDWISVQDADGAASVAFTNTGTATTPESLGISLLPVPDLSETLTDDFSTDDTVKWLVRAGGVVTGGQLVITPSATYPGRNTPVPYKLTGSYLLAEVPQVHSGTGGTETALLMTLSNTDLANYVGWLYQWISGVPTLIPRRRVANVDTSGTTLTYDNATHRWWRVRESGGSVFWDYSADGISWTNQWSTTPTIATTAMYPTLTAGIFGTDASPGTAIFDNVNLPPSGAPPATDKFFRMF